MLKTLLLTAIAGLTAATPVLAQTPAASGSGLSLHFGGYVKVDFIQDFSAIGDPNEFKTNTIPAEGSSAAAQSGGTTIHARESRLNVDLRSDGSNGPHFRAFAEGDFFGDSPGSSRRTGRSRSRQRLRRRSSPSRAA